MVRAYLFCMAVLMIGTQAAAENSSPSDVLETTRRLYREQRYDSTITVIRQFFEHDGKNPIAEHLAPILMESLVRIDDLQSAPRLYAIYLKKFASSAYMPRMHYLNGVVVARQGQTEEAVKMFSRALEAGVSRELDSLIHENILLLCEKSLSPGDVSSLLRDSKLHAGAHEALAYGAVRQYHARNQLGRARREARAFLQQYPRSRYAPVVSRMVESTMAQSGDYVPVGVLAPLSGYDADIGKRIVQGLRLAIDEYNTSAALKVKLLVSDTRSKPVRTAHKTSELINDYEVPLVIGPVLSGTAAVTAAMLMEREPVMLSPTATEDGVAELGPNIFQMNVTTGVLGRSIAEYAMTNLNINEFAVLTPLSEYGQVLSESFKTEVEKRGGVIIAEEFFDEGTSDLRPQFTTLRYELLLNRNKKDSVRAAAGEVVPKRSARGDSLTLKDSALTVGGLFIPAESDDVVMIAPQVRFFKIRTQLLGATGWHSPKTILDGKQYVENAIVVASAETGREDSVWQAFAHRFKARFGTEPDRVAALGYDAASLACLALKDLGRSVSSEQIAKRLHEVLGYRGASGVISFDSSRGVNREAVILKISNRRFIRVR